jgi:predicted transcriptional regulator of viral defense system
MTQNIILGPQENRLLLTLVEKGISVFSFDESKDTLQTSNSSVRHILMDLARKGRLQRIQRGKYLLVPEKAGGLR